MTRKEQANYVLKTLSEHPKGLTTKALSEQTQFSEPVLLLALTALTIKQQVQQNNSNLWFACQG